MNNVLLEKEVINLLHKYNLKFSAAESCTGGLLISRLIGISGASNVINESFVTYSNESKVNRLGVDKSLIKKYGVQSIEVAEAMAEGLFKVTSANVCVGVTGFTCGEIKEETDGLFYFSVKYSFNDFEFTHLEKYQVTGTRDEMRYKQTDYILSSIINSINKFVALNKLDNNTVKYK